MELMVLASIAWTRLHIYTYSNQTTYRCPVNSIRISKPCILSKARSQNVFQDKEKQNLHTQRFVSTGPIFYPGFHELDYCKSRRFPPCMQNMNIQCDEILTFLKHVIFHVFRINGWFYLSKCIYIFKGVSKRKALLVCRNANFTTMRKTKF